MSTTLYYPTKASPTTTLVLPYPLSGGTLGTPLGLDVLQITDGGTEYAYQHGPVRRRWDLSWVLTSQTTYDNLISLIRTDLDVRKNTFEINIFSTDYTSCRLIDNDLSDYITVMHQAAGCYVYMARLRFNSA